MANTITNPSFFPRRINEYVPAMQYASDVNMSSPTRVSFGSPAVAGAAAILSAQSIATAGSVDASDMLMSELDGTWGRTVQLVASGASTATVTIESFDYLGQPVTETMTANGATVVHGVKAHKSLRKITWTATAGTTINVGTDTKFGLPYKLLNAAIEVVDHAKGTLGTPTAPVLTDPATATTGDPRGLYVPNATPDGSKVIELIADFANDVNSDNNGGLHGIAHYHA